MFTLKCCTFKQYRTTFNIQSVAINKDDVFAELTDSFDINYAEENILHTNNISAEIIRFWKLDPEIVDIIEYSDKPENAPQNIKKLCTAAHVVNRLVDLKGRVKKEIPESLLPLLSEYELKPEVLSKALASL